MLKKILFDIAPEVRKSPSVQKLLRTLASSGISYVFCSECTPSSSASVPKKALFSELANTLPLPPNTCLVITDSEDGASAAQLAGIPCIGYAPAGGYENLSCAYSLFEDFASIDVGYLSRTHAHAVGYPAEIRITDRLILRELSEEDFPALYAMYTEPESAVFMNEPPSDYTTEREKHIAYVHNIYPFFELALWGVFEQASGKLIGRAGFSLPEDGEETFSLGYLIDVPYRRKGYAKECIPALLSYASEQGYTEVSARIKKENFVSVKVLEQCLFPYKHSRHTADGIVCYKIYLTE